MAVSSIYSLSHGSNLSPLCWKAQSSKSGFAVEDTPWQKQSGNSSFLQCESSLSLHRNQQGCWPPRGEVSTKENQGQSQLSSLRPRLRECHYRGIKTCGFGYSFWKIWLCSSDVWNRKSLPLENTIFHHILTH